MSSIRRYTVSTLSSELDRMVQRHWPSIEVQGEVSQLSTPASGHCYLMIRDRQATLSCVVWRSDWQQSGYKPRVGEKIIAVGRLGIFPGQSRYQLYARAVRAAGEGEWAKKLAAIKARLEADGLLDARRKRTLPKVPAVVGVVTSATGAALQDFLKVSRERWPATRILVAHSKVQGVDAAGAIIQALELLIEDGRSEVIVVTRGGGAREDLAAFDDEYLARWIASCPVPVVSAVGHQVDTTIADLVADVVAPTPSAAAMACLPDGAAGRQQLAQHADSLHHAMQRAMLRRWQRLDDLKMRLRGPTQKIRLAQARHQELNARLDGAMARVLANQKQRQNSLEARLQALSPLSVLERGYAIVQGPDGVVHSPDEVSKGTAIRVRVAGGSFDAEVCGVRRSGTKRSPGS